MKVKIINVELQDSIILEGKNIKNIRATALAEVSRRGWKTEDCYSEVIE